MPMLHDGDARSAFPSRTTQVRACGHDNNAPVPESRRPPRGRSGPVQPSGAGARAPLGYRAAVPPLLALLDTGPPEPVLSANPRPTRGDRFMSVVHHPAPLTSGIRKGDREHDLNRYGESRTAGMAGSGDTRPADLRRGDRSVRPAARVAEGGRRPERRRQRTAVDR